MVSGINLNNYSAAQLQELQKAGMQISDEDIEAAKKREEQEKANKADDEANVSYTITDDAGEVNEAEQEIKTATEYGANLKTVLETLIPKCQTKDGEMAKLQEEMNKYAVTMQDLGFQATQAQTDINAEIADLQTIIDQQTAELEKKKEELDENLEIIDDVNNNDDASEDDIKNAEDASNNAESLQEEISSGSMSAKKMQEVIKTRIKEVAITKATLLGKSMEDVKNQAQQSLNDAVNANEYADVTIDKGMEAASITDKGVAKDAGFSKRGGFLGWGKRKGDVGAANRMGNTAIAFGEQLGNSSTGVAKTIKTVGSQFGMNFAKTSSIEEMVNKEYVDTSKMDELVDLKETKGIVGFIKGVKNNKEIIEGIAEEAKKKKNGETETKPET